MVSLDESTHTRPSWRAAPALLAPLVALTALSWAGTAGAAALAPTAPLVLIALSPRMPFLILAAASSPMPAFVAVATARLFLADPINYKVGLMYGPATLGWTKRRLPIAGKIATLTERAMRRFGLLAVACRPNASVLMMAGSAKMCWRKVLAAAFAGTVSYSAVLHLTVSGTGAGAVAATARASSRSALPLLPLVAAAAAAGVVFVLVRRARHQGHPPTCLTEPAGGTGLFADRHVC
jgi:membrane protein DedA with SNARE-associated domain